MRPTKLLEKAGAGVGEPSMSAQVLEWMYGIQNDDFGGVTMPISFVRNQPGNLPLCWFNVSVKKGAWSIPDAFNRNCDH